MEYDICVFLEINTLYYTYVPHREIADHNIESVSVVSLPILYDRHTVMLPLWYRASIL